MALSNDRFLRACRRQPVDATPIWLMRQAGRYMREYRELRARHSMFELCQTPDLVVRVTLQPVRRFPLDAAIIFSDLLVPLQHLGLPFEFAKGEGPRVDQPLRAAADVGRLHPFEPREALSPVLEAIRLVKAELDGRVPLIGFAGAPFTLASYAIEGGHSNHYAHTKALMYTDPATWHRLCHLFAETSGEYLKAQVEAGCDAVQVFDSWVGALGPADYREFVLPHARRLFEIATEAGVPTIHFGTGTATLLGLMSEAGGDVVGVDWRIALDEAWQQVGNRAIQGNLDPTLLLGPPHRMLAGAEDVLHRAAGRPGHIFNLGHGILPETPVEQVEALAEFVHGWKVEGLGARG